MLTQGDKVKIIGNSTNHPFKVGDIATFCCYDEAYWQPFFYSKMGLVLLSKDDYEII
jgi:hypothetical protein